MSNIKLKDLIKQVRNCKTAAEERAVVARECAAVRAAFSEADSLKTTGTGGAAAAAARHRGVSKLLYVHMLGYPTQFGQMECIKLASSPRYADKRVGYLGLMLLLDETSDVITLVTNTLQQDLHNSNQYVVGLALCALGNIASASMARDLSIDVEKLLSSNSPYIRKKAALAATRIIRKCPDLCENYVTKVKNFYLQEKNHGVLLAASALILELCNLMPAAKKALYSIVPFTAKVIKTLISSGYDPDYDVSGLTDPFLQVKMLRILRVLGPLQLERGEERHSNFMKDILAQVATNTESTRNVGNAVLYECVQTILALPPSENALHVMAINVLGRFLTNKDNNIRYVALNTLNTVVTATQEGVKAVQRHRNIIVDCLRDPDISIRRRALDLVYALVDSGNVTQLTRDLMGYLVSADSQFRPDIAAKLCWLVEKYAPNPRWRFDTLLRIISANGDALPDDVPASLCALITEAESLQSYAVQRLYSALVADPSQTGALATVALWSFGEFGDLLCGTLAAPVASGDEEDSKAEYATASPDQIIDLIENVLHINSNSENRRDRQIQQYAVNALGKLTMRFPESNTAVQQRLQKILGVYKFDISPEIQQRACEFGQLISCPPAVRTEVLDRMPPVEETDFTADGVAPAAGGAAAKPAAAAAATSVGDDLLSQLMGAVAPAPAVAAAAPAAQPAAANDILGALFGSAPVPTPAAAGGLLAPPSITAYDSANMKIVFTVQHPNNDPHLYEVAAAFSSVSAVPITNIILRVAVPKWLKLDLQSASGDMLQPMQAEGVRQTIRLANTSTTGQPVVLRIKVTYTAGGMPVDETKEVSFPANI